MDNFKFETQGTNTYIVYELDKPELLDSMTLGMITNNKIPGLAPAFFFQQDSAKFVKYNISSKISAEQFLMGTVNKKRLIGVFKGIVNAMISAEEYMIDTNSLCLDLQYIYTDVSTCETVVICLPVMELDKPIVDLKSFFKNIVFSTQFDQTENGDYIAKLINYLNSPSVFSLNDFKEVLDVIEHGVKPVSAPQPQAPVQSTPQVQPQAPVQPTSQVQPQVSVQSTPQVKPQVQPTVQQETAPVKSVAPQAPVQPVMQKVPSPAAKLAAPNPGYAVPGKGASDANKKSKDTPVPEGEISFMYLMQHYNKENAAAYKAQQEAKKAAKAAGAPAKEDKKKNKKEKAPKKAAMPPVPNGTAQNPGFAIPGQATPQQTAGSYAGPTQQPAAPQPTVQPQAPAQQVAPQPTVQQPVAQPQAPVQPAPQAPVSQMYQQPVMQVPPQSSMNFGETTVLSSAGVGETTVLGATPTAMEMNPYLIRTKNNERIILDKPNFRIGKEKSFVDYFIGDNTAISRSHANIITRDGEYFVMDTNSTNHTYVDGQMIQSNVEVKISHGTKIKLANEDFEFKIY